MEKDSEHVDQRYLIGDKDNNESDIKGLWQRKRLMTLVDGVRWILTMGI